MKMNLNFKLLLPTAIGASLHLSTAWSVALPPSLGSELNLPISAYGECQQLKKDLNSEVMELGKNASREAQEEKMASLAGHYHCHAFKKHLNHDAHYDQYSVLPGWNQLFEENENFATKKIEGKIKYMGFVSLPYSYTISRDPITKKFTVDVKIHVKKWSTFSDPFKTMDEKVKINFLKRQFDLLLTEISTFWNNNSLGATFRITRTEIATEADFSIFMRQQFTSNKYNSRWDWLPSTDPNLQDEAILRMIRYGKDHIDLAHEVGHMLGLEDEYSLPNSVIAGLVGTINSFIHSNKTYSKTLSRADIKALGCDPGSIMCKEWTDTTKVHDYHLYLILNRYFDK